MSAHAHAHSHDDAPDDAPTRDPVCGMDVDPDAGKPAREHDGRVFHFCSD